MKLKLYVLLGILCISVYGVTASSMFFTLYNKNIFTAPSIFSAENNYYEAVGSNSFFNSFYDSFETTTSQNAHELSSGTEISITQDGFHPKKLIIEKGQTVIWINDRASLEALVIGVREISEMRSSFLEHSNTFTWTFAEPGEYTYVDAVMIGTVGMIVVQ
ncbi:hypothetical protein COV17_00905 [Candidatus Woesearchaeota archaeon CG10_big_fil_rev_8_21_14_0_10_36_11]|nr:MAG: hypothetical protein COV17_00905 [Candidatus Woesearchaeota archaeon CG10_big_fil_rev_8_21_14_0_10_36_11]